MQIEHTQIKGYNYSYHLEKCERLFFIECLEKKIKQHEAKIERINNHPKNEGQIQSREIKDAQHQIHLLKQ